MATNMDVLCSKCTVVNNNLLVNMKMYYNLKEYFTDNSTSSKQNSGHVMWRAHRFCHWTELSAPHSHRPCDIM